MYGSLPSKVRIRQEMLGFLRDLSERNYGGFSSQASENLIGFLESDIDFTELTRILSYKNLSREPVSTDLAMMLSRKIPNSTQIIEIEYLSQDKGQDIGDLSDQDWDYILIPGLAFDKTGARLGRGGGWFDRLIEALHENHKDPKLIGVCFEDQIITKVPVEPHDKKMDLIVTNNNIYYSTKRAVAI